MILKILLLLIISITFSFASFQELKIGKIDEYYKDKLSYEQLKAIIDEIEQTLESQLNMNIFDYSMNGKDIDILFVPASKLEKRIDRKIEKLAIKKEKLKVLQNSFLSKEDELEGLKKATNEQTKYLNEKIDEFNNYVKNFNKKKLSKEEYIKSQKFIASKKENIQKDIKLQKKRQRELKKVLNSYNQKIFTYNNSINEYNRLSNEVETMTRSFRKVKGKTFGMQEITLKTYNKDGIEVKEKSVKNSMTKIEIYGFDNLKQLKVVLAHEIGHLVGIPHIENKGALMNPIVQKNQEMNLSLTQDDIKAFKENF